MIIANMATYPKRIKFLREVLEAVAPQVDRLNVVLNEYDEVPPEVQGIENVAPIIPEEDTKDVGKFYPNVAGAKYVFLIDDDIVYPQDFVEKSIDRFEALGAGGFIASYHGSIYEKPQMWRSAYKKNRKGLRRLLPRLYEYPLEIALHNSRMADFRRVLTFYKGQSNPIIVDQIATCAAVLRGCDMPSYSYMRDSQKFVDVRLAKWAFEKDLECVVLCREKDWLKPIRYEETIFHDFTKKNVEHVNDEIRAFAGKFPNVGKIVA